MTSVVIAGGHGKIALLLERLLADRGDSVVGLIRNPDHVADVERTGASAVVLDLENATVEEVAAQLHGVDAVVFAAGAGPGSGAARKDTVDRAAAVLLADAAIAAGVGRYVMVSAMGADGRPADQTADPVFAAYLQAKAEADAYVTAQEALASTIVRPGLLTDEPGTGLVAVDAGRGSIPRADVAAVLAEVLRVRDTAGRTFDLIGGATPVREAVAAL
jgi:nucleoside-diphosphate-sugar epimerase